MNQNKTYWSPLNRAFIADFEKSRTESWLSIVSGGGSRGERSRSSSSGRSALPPSPASPDSSCPPPPCQSWTPWTSCSPHPPPPPLPSSQDNGHDQPESPVIQIIIRVCPRSRETRKRGAQSVKEKNTSCEKSPLKSGFSALRKIYI